MDAWLKDVEVNKSSPTKKKKRKSQFKWNNLLKKFQTWRTRRSKVTSKKNESENQLLRVPSICGLRWLITAQGDESSMGWHTPPPASHCKSDCFGHIKFKLCTFKWRVWNPLGIRAWPPRSLPSENVAVSDARSRSATYHYIVLRFFFVFFSCHAAE